MRGEDVHLLTEGAMAITPWDLVDPTTPKNNSVGWK